MLLLLFCCVVAGRLLLLLLLLFCVVAGGGLLLPPAPPFPLFVFATALLLPLSGVDWTGSGVTGCGVLDGGGFTCAAGVDDVAPRAACTVTVSSTIRTSWLVKVFCGFVTVLPGVVLVVVDRVAPATVLVCVILFTEHCPHVVGHTKSSSRRFGEFNEEEEVVTLADAEMEGLAVSVVVEEVAANPCAAALPVTVTVTFLVDVLLITTVVLPLNTVVVEGPVVKTVVSKEGPVSKT